MDKIRRNIPVAPFEGGKLPPQVLELEESVLGSLMIDKAAINIVYEILTPECFYKDAHLNIYKAIVTLYQKREPIDLLTVTQELREQGILEIVGGSFFISQLTMRLTSAANVEFHARIIKEKYLQRQMIRIGNVIIQKGYEDTTDVFELISEADKAIFDLTKDSAGNYENTIGELYNIQIKNCENKKEGTVEGYLTGLKEVDRLIQGIKKQELFIIAARPGMGKTSFALTIAKNLASLQNIPVGFFSLEMKRQALCARFTSLITTIPIEFLINNDVRNSMFDRLMLGKPKAEKTKLVIDDQGGLTCLQLRTKIRNMIKKHKIEVVIVDYLTKMKGENVKGRSDASIVDSIASGLKDIAKEFDLPVICLAQLNRDVEKRPDKRPQLSDLKESGGIEQEADLVGFLYRPEYYGEKPLTEDKVPMPTGYTEFIIKKNRNGALGTGNLIFKNELTRFEDFSPYSDHSTYDVDVTNKDLGIKEDPF